MLLNIVGMFSILCLSICESAKINRIYGGVMASAGEFPYLISLREGDRHVCGGSLITKRHVLTAAHCIIDYLPPGNLTSIADTVTVVAGKNTLFKGGKTYLVEKMIPHEKYEVKPIFNDIAIIKLKTDVELSDLIKIIPLAEEKEYPKDAKMLVSGYGLFYQGNAQKDSLPLSMFLRKAVVPHISNEQCQAWWKKMTITESQLCTSSDRGAVCNGDSGGPLVFEDKLVGVVSYSSQYCGGEAPVVYTKVSAYKSFIKDCIDNS